ncbi:hypothetical protein CXG81DRAFT_27800 [Caulochytrium protostelioides]|uniref:Uncharacterized protein n=1 Tax=Caulochytrium protostelioides TaxID=1555241 RepID=A0A4P9X351_9FUNG|nr:hypothetical protein CXG81DRAFT_27800 [Caulochytrium protostelioides]|eukprot:RKO99430.1 hypothetical protein CXG81DRAFT_27800 [Caulochytrium protostelioides]
MHSRGQRILSGTAILALWTGFLITLILSVCFTNWFNTSDGTNGLVSKYGMFRVRETVLTDGVRGSDSRTWSNDIDCLVNGFEFTWACRLRRAAAAFSIIGIVFGFFTWLALLALVMTKARKWGHHWCILWWAFFSAACAASALVLMIKVKRAFERAPYTPARVTRYGFAGLGWNVISLFLALLTMLILLCTAKDRVGSLRHHDAIAPRRKGHKNRGETLPTVAPAAAPSQFAPMTYHPTNNAVDTSGQNPYAAGPGLPVTPVTAVHQTNTTSHVVPNANNEIDANGMPMGNHAVSHMVPVHPSHTAQAPPRPNEYGSVQM